MDHHHQPFNYQAFKQGVPATLSMPLGVRDRFGEIIFVSESITDGHVTVGIYDPYYGMFTNIALVELENLFIMKSKKVKTMDTSNEFDINLFKLGAAAIDESSVERYEYQYQGYDVNRSVVIVFNITNRKSTAVEMSDAKQHLKMKDCTTEQFRKSAASIVRLQQEIGDRFIFNQKYDVETPENVVTTLAEELLTIINSNCEIEQKGQVDNSTKPKDHDEEYLYNILKSFR